MVSDFPSTLNKQEYKNLILKCLDKNNNFDIKRISALASENQAGLSEQDAIVILENFGAILSDMWKSENNIKEFKDVALKALNARKGSNYYLQKRYFC